MITFSKDSWHYQACCFLRNDWDPVPESLCPYIRAVFWGVFRAVAVAGFLAVELLSFIDTLFLIHSSLNGSFESLWYIPKSGNRILPLAMLFIATLGVAILVAILCALDWWKQRLREKRYERFQQLVDKDLPPKEPSLLVEWIKAIHTKMCPSIQFVNKSEKK